MSTITLHPTADTDGWVNTPIKVADYLLSHFFLSEYSQTAHFPGKVASFPWLIQHYQGDIERIRQEVQSTLSEHFLKQFTAVDIQVGEVTSAALTADSINKKHLSLYLVITDSDGVDYNLSRIIEYTEDLKITNIISVTNTGN